MPRSDAFVLPRDGNAEGGRHDMLTFSAADSGDQVS